MAKTWIYLIIGAGAAIAVGAFAMKPDPAQSFALLTQGESTALAASEQPADEATAKTRSMKVTSSSGPAIKVSAPSGYALSSPVDFDIRIEPRNGVKVDMKSIRIEYRIGPTWINVTRRIMKYANVKGSRLYATGAELPAGKHAMRVSVRDANAQVTKATVSFTVAK